LILSKNSIENSQFGGNPYTLGKRWSALEFLKGRGFEPGCKSSEIMAAWLEAAPFQNLNADLRVFPQPGHRMILGLE
jgi:hypothetical protein